MNRMLVVVAISVGAAGGARADPDPAATVLCKARCTLPAAMPDYTQVTIDANTGRLVSGPTLISEGTKYQFNFVHKNPFKYGYRFPVAQQSADSAAASAYLHSIVTGGTSVRPSRGATEQRFASRAQQCQGLPNQEAVDQWLGELKPIREGAAAGLKTLQEDLDRYRDAASAFHGKTDTEDLTTTPCEEICAEATGLAASARRLSATAPTSLATIRRQESAFEAALKNPPDKNCAKTLEPEYQGNEEKLLALEKLHAQLADEKSGLFSLGSFVADRLQDTRMFHEASFSSPADGAQAIRVEVRRTNLRQKPPQVETMVNAIDFRAGRGRVTITAGAMISGLPNNQIVRQQAVLDDGTIGARFGHQTASAFTIAPTVLLNVRVLDPHWAGLGWIPPVHATFGILGGEDAVEYLLGGSISLVDAVFLTFGVHVGPREELTGFSIGDPVPPGLTDPLPVTTTWHAGFGFGMTFRFQ